MLIRSDVDGTRPFGPCWYEHRSIVVTDKKKMMTRKVSGTKRVITKKKNGMNTT